MSSWQEAIEREWERRTADAEPGGCRFPLMSHAYDVRDVLAATETLLSGQLTMASGVRAFERRFADLAGARHAVMVNSGSSANLLSVAALCNPARPNHLMPGDEVLIPAVCWSTSLSPLLHFGLRPVLVDVDPATLNLSIEDARRRITSRTRAVVAVHVLGNSCPLDELLELISEHGLLLIEDTCESLSSRSGGRFLGTFGEFGTYSFYYSHHITTGEGGMVVCRDDADYDLLQCLRAHGWSRDVSDRTRVESANPDLDPRFLFINAGFNVRPTEVQAAIGMRQLDRLELMNQARNSNRVRLIEALRRHPGWHDQFAFPAAPPDIEPVWFGFPALIRDGRDRAQFLRWLEKRGVENRPIVSGNFARQPALKLFGINIDPGSLPGAEEVHHRGFFIGLQNQPLAERDLHDLADILLTS